MNQRRGSIRIWHRIGLVCAILSTALCAHSGAAFTGAARPASPRPNIILILADDLGIGDVSLHGSAIRTPNIDRLAREGARLTHFYSSANVCTPSRAGLLTGRYAIRSGLAQGVVEADSVHGLPQRETTLAELLEAEGYRTAVIGKWHLGHAPEFWPTRHGFDYYFGLPYSNDMKGVALYRGEEKIEEPVEQSTLTQRYTAEAERFIEADPETPFFLYLAHTFPHIPLHASDDFRGKSDAGLYGDTVEELDWSVGRVLALLDEKQLSGDTLVFFTSDNGAWFEGSNGEFRDMKGQSWDGGYRVPLFARWPGRIESGTVSDAIAMNIDILPTVAAVLGIEHGLELDGRDIWSLLQGGSISPHEALYLFNNEDIAAVRAPRWKYLVLGHWRSYYVAFEDFGPAVGFDYPLLFDMREAWPERFSRAADHPEVLREMKRLLESGRAQFERFRTRSAAATIP
jgi:uncharacterized sulfatase